MYNIHLGHWNIIANGAKDAKKKKEQQDMENISTNRTDLEVGFANGLTSYALLMTEFESDGLLRNHVIQKGWRLVKPSRNNYGVNFDDFFMSGVI